MGTPFVHQGRIPGLALDCAGFIAGVISRLGLPVNDAKGYPREPYQGMLKAHLDKEPSLEQIFKLEDDCVVLFKIIKDPQHLALYRNNQIIHAYATAGKVVAHRFGGHWNKNIVAMYRIVDE
jgi:cell wall-associated NlpC family hydrolase